MRMSELHAEREIIPDMVDDQITLRDRFAMAALPFFIGKTSNDDDADHAAIMAYTYADAMMRERQWPPTKEED